MSEEDEPRPRRTYSSELVAHALRRAARLQVEAAEATERRSAPTSADDDPEGHGHRELLEAAREAGIDEEFMTVALAELDGGEGTTSLALPTASRSSPPRAGSAPRSATCWSRG